MELTECIGKSTGVALYADGKESFYCRGGAEFSALERAWKEMTEGALRMPAFGVSIDALTREEMKKGIWAEFVFDGVQKVGEMPFERLLVGVKPEFCGFNLIRFFEGKYAGRCFYLDLRGKTMRLFYDAVISMA